MVTIHAADASDFSSLGLGALAPSKLEIEERAGGMFELRMTHPMDDAGKWHSIEQWRIIKAPTPVRETPLVEMGHASTTVVRKVYRVSVNTRLRLRTEPSTSTGKIIGRYKSGTRVIRTDVSGSWYKVIVEAGGATGWMHSDYLRYVEDITETVQGDAPGQVIQPRQTREQLFRIVTVERDEANAEVRVTARHIFYDLSGNTVKGDYAPEGVAADEVCAQLLARTVKPHGFQIFCTAEGAVSADYGGQSIVSALLEKEIGVATQTGARVIRDNFDVFLLADEVRDRGVVIRHGKNLIGAVLTEDASDVVTCIEPVGKGKDGKPLYLDGDGVVESPRAAQLPVSRVKRMEYDVSVVAKKADANPEEGKYATEAEARARLRELAAAEFDNGADGVAVRLDVDFVALEGAEGYEQYAELQSIHLYDTVHVQAPRIGINAAVRMTAYVWDALALGGHGKYKSVTLGQLEDLQTTTYGYDIAGGTVNGTKLIAGSVAGSRLRNASIDYAKISVAAIEQLAANSITALTAHIGQIVAGEIEADKLYADLATIAVAQITTANIEKANIDWAAIGNLSAEVARIAAAQITTANIISADIRWADIQSLTAAMADVAQAKIADAQITTAQIADLRAEIARVITLAAQDGKFDFASIKDLLAGAMILEEGVAGSVYIKNLVATRANFVGATLGELVLRGADGNYYAVTVQADGTIRTQPVTVSDGEIASGQTSDGRQIVATTANIADLNAGNIRAASAIISEIFAGALQAGKISAQEAFLASATVPELRVTALKAIGDTLDISANAQIRLLVSDVATAQGAASAAQSSANAAQSSANAAMEKATANATAIEQNAQQIALRATQADLSGVASTLRGEMTVAADGIRAQVSSLGGNNLLRNGGFYFGLDGWERLEYNVNGDWRNLYVETGASDYRANEVPNLVLQAQNETGAFGVFQHVYGLRKNTDYTISGYVASHRCNRPIVQVTNQSTTVWKLLREWDVGWGGTNLSAYDRFAYTFNTGDDTDLSITLCSTSYGEDAFLWWAQIKLEEGTVATAWSPHASETYTSGIEIHDNRVDVKTGGSFNVHSGSVDISTSNFRVSVQKPGDPESEVIGIDPDYGRISVDELNAKNVRPYVGYAEYRLSNLGSIREFANILSRTSFGQVSMILDADEYGTTPVRFEDVTALNVSIVSDGTLRSSPPWIFGQCSASFYVDGVCWSCLTGYDANPQNGNTAIVAFSGNILLRNCRVKSAYWGIRAYQSSKVSWCGWTNHGNGYCTDMFCIGNEGADIAIYGYVPGSANGTMGAWDAARGLERNVTILSSDIPPAPSYASTTLTGDLGWISTKKGWTDGLAYQGYTTGKGECYGCFKFSLPAATTIVSATLTLRRKSSTGKGAPVDIHLYGSATAWGSRPTLGTLYASRADAVLAGNTVSLDVTAAAQALLTGSIAQLVAYEGDGSTLSGQAYSTDYCAWDIATLDVTYTN